MYNLKRTIYLTISVVALAILSPLPALAQISFKVANTNFNTRLGNRNLINRIRNDAIEAIDRLEYEDITAKTEGVKR